MVRLVLFLIASVAYGQIDLTKQTKSNCAAGRVFFAGASGQVQCDGSIVWDNTNKRLGIGTATPESFLDVRVVNFNDTPHFMRTTPVTNTLVTTLRLRKHVSGTAADGVGPSITFLLSDTASGTTSTLGQFGMSRTGANNRGAFTARYEDNTVAFYFPHLSVGAAYVPNDFELRKDPEVRLRLIKPNGAANNKNFEILHNANEVQFRFFNDANTAGLAAIRILHNPGDHTVSNVRIQNGKFTIVQVQVFADNAAAISGGLQAGDVYRTPDGTLKVVF